jgi:hypothetical protein
LVKTDHIDELRKTYSKLKLNVKTLGMACWKSNGYRFPAKNNGPTEEIPSANREK